jgi:predicted transposase/invertase (TIGR01784 family)
LALLPLKSDLIFHLVFGDPRYIEIIRAFLVEVLDIPAEEYEGLEIIDPNLERDRPNDKLGILDVRVQLKNRKLISVEIQIRETPFMAERVAFSTGRNLSRQIAPGQGYSQIEKVVTIVITNYDMIAADDHYRHIFKLFDAEKKILFTDIVEIHTLELKKLPKDSAANESERGLLNWLRLIRSERREEIEMLATQTPEMEMAVNRLKHLSADERTRMLYEARELAIMDEMARTEAAVAKAEAKGIAKGKAEGKLENKIEVAKNMLDSDFDLDTISKISGLSLDKIKSLR